MLAVNVVTLFPGWFAAPLGESILGRAADGVWCVTAWCSCGTSPTTGTRRWTTTPTAAAPGWCSSRSRSSRRWRAWVRGGRRSCCSRRGAGASATTTRCGSRWERSSRCSAATTRTWTSGWPTASGPRSCRSATSSCRAASRRRSACSTRWCGCCRARWATTRSRSGDSHYDGLLARRATPGRRSIAGWRCPRYCWSGITRRSRRGGRQKAERLTRERRPDLWERLTESEAGSDASRRHERVRRMEQAAERSPVKA